MMDLGAQLEAATLSLAGAGTIKDRLLAAYCSHLADLREADLPLDVRADFAEMTRALHSARALPGDDVVKASVRKLSNAEASRYATLVVKLYGMLAGAKYHVAVVRNARATAPLAKLLAVESAAVSS
jgi:hypothetical protein